MLLPWTKREVVDTVTHVYSAPDDHPEGWATSACIGIFASLALGKPEGRFFPMFEHELYLRIARVWDALQHGRDPYAAYEVPLPRELLTAHDQPSQGYRDLQKLLQEWGAIPPTTRGQPRTARP